MDLVFKVKYRVGGSVFFLVVVFFLSLNPVFVASVTAASVTIDVEWKCYQTVQGMKSPQKIPITIDFEKETFDFFAVNTLMSEASAKYPDIDYFSCFLDLANEVFSQAFYKNKKNMDFLYKLHGAIEKSATQYGAGAYKRGATSPIEPGQKATVKFTNEEKSHFKNNFSWCGYGLNETALEESNLHAVKSLASDLSPDCMKKLAAKYAKLLLNSQMSREQCRTHLEGCAKRNMAVGTTYAYLLETPLGLYFKRKLKSFSPCDAPSLNEKLNAFITELDQISSCVKLHQSESEKISGERGSGRSSAYTLSRLTDRRLPNGKDVPVYEAVVDLKFLNLNFKSSPEFQKKYSDLVTRCYEEANPTLRGPNGEFLEIRLFQKPDFAITPAPNEIKIIPKGARSNSVSWEENINCAMILHETFHLLGLVDKYPEYSSGVTTADDGTFSYFSGTASESMWDCRVLGPNDSIMATHTEAYDAVFGRNLSVQCACTEPGKDCLEKLRALKKSPPSSCPDYTFQYMEPVNDINKPGFILKDAESIALVLRVEPSKPTRQTLLYPAEFRAITQPGCFAANSTYYRCAQEAYKTSRGHLGKEGCSVGLPEACKKGKERSAEWLK